jgi:hypothetical protein
VLHTESFSSNTGPPSGRIAGDESAVWRVVFATMVPIWIFTVSSFRPWGQHYYNDVLDATRCS